MKKPYSCFLASVLFCVFTAYPLCARTGIGFQADFQVRSELPSETGVAFDNALSLTVASDALPWVFSLQARLKDQYAGFTCDNWVIYQPLSRRASWFFFYGTSGGIEAGGAHGLYMGPRLGAGMNLFAAARHLELYAQAAWNPFAGVRLSPDDSESRFFIQPLVFPVNAGLRVWFP
ncbi:MAG: hypothetical protein K6G80_03640 [Treponema sp.]|nr:hypothetical protein [Treponema sp.]